MSAFVTVFGTYKCLEEQIKNVCEQLKQSNFTVTHCNKINYIAVTMQFMIFVSDNDTDLHFCEAFVSAFGFHDTETGKAYF